MFTIEYRLIHPPIAYRKKLNRSIYFMAIFKCSMSCSNWNRSKTIMAHWSHRVHSIKRNPTKMFSNRPIYVWKRQIKFHSASTFAGKPAKKAGNVCWFTSAAIDVLMCSAHIWCEPYPAKPKLKHTFHNPYIKYDCVTETRLEFNRFIWLWCKAAKHSNFNIYSGN